MNKWNVERVTEDFFGKYSKENGVLLKAQERISQLESEGWEIVNIYGKSNTVDLFLVYKRPFGIG